MIYMAYIYHSKNNRQTHLFVDADNEDEAKDIAEEHAQYLYGSFGKIDYIVDRADIFVHSNERGSGYWIDLNKIKY